MPLKAAWDRAWSGTCDPLVFAIVRIGLASLVLLRVADWTAPWLSLDHHAWVHGLDHAPWTEAIREPALHAPLVPGLPSVTSPWAGALAIARPVLAVLLLLGLRPRAAALALAVCGYGAMALDRGRYFHHLHLLWLSCAWLALTPCGARLSVEALLRRDPREDRSPRWSLTLLRFQALVVYAAAGIAKLQPAWIDGTALAQVSAVYPFGGPFFELGRDAVGLSGLAIAIAAWELALVPLLAWPRTRLLGVILGIGLHGVLDTSTLVSTFGATMALYLLTFLPWERRDPAKPHGNPPREGACPEPPGREKCGPAAPPGIPSGDRSVRPAPAMASTMRPKRALLLLLAPLALAGLAQGCGGENIPNTDVPDNAENRAVIEFVEGYRHAVENRDVGGILSLVSERFYDDNGTITTEDDRDFDRLREQLARFGELLDVRYEMRYRNVLFRPDRIFVDYTYTASFKVSTPEGDHWETRLRDNRIELVREGEEFRIISGI